MFSCLLIFIYLLILLFLQYDSNTAFENNNNKIIIIIIIIIMINRVGSLRLTFRCAVLLFLSLRNVSTPPTCHMRTYSDCRIRKHFTLPNMVIVTTPAGTKIEKKNIYVVTLNQRLFKVLSSLKSTFEVVLDKLSSLNQ